MKYEIQKTLVVSTGHITQEDGDQLIKDADSNLNAMLIVYRYGDFGHTILIPRYDDLSYLVENYSMSLVVLLQIAQKQECQYLLLDRDGPIYSNLSLYDW